MIKRITWILAIIPSNISCIAAINISIIIDLFWDYQYEMYYHQAYLSIHSAHKNSTFKFTGL